jgi:hypothetical protein
MKTKIKWFVDLFLMVLAILAIVMIYSCKRTSKNEEFIGPQVKEASAQFSVVGNQFSASSPSVNFYFAQLYFTSNFSESVTWKITITGMLSGAVKELTGTSSSLNASNSLWTGDSDNIYFFRKGEKCIVQLTISGSTLVLTTTVLIINVYDYDGNVINGVSYTLIDDFDGGGVPMASISKDGFDSGVIMGVDTLVKVQGLKSFKMEGIDVNGNSWSGGINHTSLKEIKLDDKSPKTTDPKFFYINLYVYGTGKPNSAIEVKAFEVDDTLNLKNIASYTYEQNKNDAWIVDLPVTWTGWKLVSLQYSSFRPAADPSAGGNGNKIREPNKITGLAISLLSFPNPLGHTGLSIDYVTFTEGGVFIP